GKARRGAETGQPTRIKLHIGIAAKKTHERHVARERGDGGAVLRRDIVKVIDCAQTTGARHVLYDHRRMSGNELAEMPRKQPRMDVVAATWPIADDQIDLPALVEVGERVRVRGGDR